MAVDIAKLPRGLTSLLSLRDQGATPRLLADQVVQTLDSRDLFLLDTRVLIDVAHQLAPAIGYNQFTVPIVVPAGELWYCWHYFVSASVAAAEAIQLCAAFQPDGLPIGVPLSPLYPPATAAAGAREIRVGGSNFWAGPGTIFGFHVETITGAPSVDGGLVVTKLKV